MNLAISNSFRSVFVLLVAALLMSGCADSRSIEPDSIGEASIVSSSVIAPPLQTSTRVTFDITVPAYVSSALQIRLYWGDKELTGTWIIDESWTLADDFPTNTENLLVVIFSDGNGELTLGSFEQEFKTGSNITQTFVIAADQFNTDQWDSDSDGVSNINEQNVEPDAELVVAGIARILNESPALTLIEPVRYLASLTGNLTDRTLGEPMRVTTTSNDEIIRTQVSCNNGGSYVHDFLGGPRGGSSNIYVSNCNIGGKVYNGNAFLMITSIYYDSVVYEQFSALELSGDQFVVESGKITRRRTDGRNYAEISQTDVEFKLIESGQQLIVSALNQAEDDRIAVPLRTSLTTSFNVVGLLTAGETAFVSTLVTLQGAGVTSRNYIVGKLEVISGMDSLVVDMDTGDANTYSVVSTSAESVTSEILPWENDTNFGCVTHPASSEILELCER